MSKTANEKHNISAAHKAERRIKVRNVILLFITALIWGCAFVAQKKGGEDIPFTFNSVRSFIGGLVLIPSIFVLDRLGLTKGKPKSPQERKLLIKGGILCGLALCVASNLQQLGMYYGSEASKASFLTTLYILMVPILGLFLKRKCSFNIWIGVVIALVGMYLLCVKGNITEIEGSDLLLIATAFVFSLHIIIIDHFTPKVDGVRMSCIQLFVAGALTMIPAYFFDISYKVGSVDKWAEILFSGDIWISILYAGIMSSGIAYTLQIIGQNKLNPAVAALIMSFESVFGTVASWIILGERLSFKECMGCVLIFVAVVIAQVRFGSKKK